jgi:glycosyltransferase involved in cell wall biosynthesis
MGGDPKARRSLMTLPTTAAEQGKTKRPIRVLQLLAMLDNGGVEKWVVDLSEQGSTQGLAMDIAVVHEVYGLFARRARGLGIPIFHCAASENPFRFVRNLRRLLREHGPYDAIHCHIHAYSGFAVLAAWLEGVRARVVHSHNVVRNSSKSPVRRAYGAIARGLIGMFATAGMGPSTASTEDLLGRGWRKDRRWRVLRCGIDLTPFRAPVPATSSRAAFGIRAGALVLGSVGRLSEEKNSEFLVDVLAAVLERAPNAYLLLIGEGALRDRLAAKARDGGFGERLLLPGVRPDVVAILRNVVDVFVFPSPPPPRGNEALPIAVVEAQAAGLPTVISDGITTEAIVVPELVTQIPEAAGARRWAEVVLDQARPKDAGLAERALAMVEHSDFNCARTLLTLAKLYAGEPAD